MITSRDRRPDLIFFSIAFSTSSGSSKRAVARSSGSANIDRAAGFAKITWRSARTTR
jgi:hypothetical protein